MIETLAVSGYRSLRDVALELGPITVVTGPNGSGKSSLHRALRLLADVAQGRVVASLAAEGGLASTLWAGPESFGQAVRRGVHPVQGTRRKGPVSLRLGFSGAEGGYAIDLGLPVPPPWPTLFGQDPEIKAEALWTGRVLGRANLVAERHGAAARLRTRRDGTWREAGAPMAAFDSLLSHCADVEDGIELLTLRERMRGWRFYDDLRTDRDAPARRPQVGTRTPVLAGDGADLGAAVQTILEIGDAEGLQATVGDAFDGASLSVNDRFEVEMSQHGLLRPLRAAELSDGTLRYLLLAAALLSPRPPELMVLNEPEASLHADLLPPLARLIARAAEICQVVVVSHAAGLAQALARDPRAVTIRLEKELGETRAVDADRPRWAWPTR